MKLHEKKISELMNIPCECGSGKGVPFDKIPMFVLRKWAIAVVKESPAWCKSHKKIAEQDYDGDGRFTCCKYKSCGWDDIGVVEFLIDKFEITKEDLNEDRN